jgi:hypothetical protein
MPARNELDLLSGSRPAILDRSAEVMDKAEEERVLQLILHSDPVRSRASEGPPHRGVARQRNVLVVAAAVVLLTGLAAFSLRQQPGGNQGRWKLVGDISSASWQDVSPLGLAASFSLTCPSTSTCYADVPASKPGAFDAIQVTEDGGISWQTAGLPSTISRGSEISCWSSDSCTQVGLDSSGDAVVVTTSDGGANWTAAPGPSGLSASFGEIDLSCTGAGACVAVASDPADPTASSLAFVSTDGGSDWSQSSLAPNFAAGSLRCVPVSQCVLVGHSLSVDSQTGLTSGLAFYSADGGSVWQAASLPAGLGQMSSLSCDSAGCLAGALKGNGQASGLATSADGGRSWSEATESGLPSALVMGLACPSSTGCWATGLSGASISSDGSGLPVINIGSSAAGVVASSSDGGQSWQQGHLPSGVVLVADPSCPSSSTCYALGVLGAAPSGPISFALLSYQG